MKIVKQKDQKTYESPSVKKLTIRQARSYILKHGREFLSLLLRNDHQQNEIGAPPKRGGYQPPRLTKLTAEQAKLKLLGHLSLGDRGAKDLLDLLFPEPSTALSESPEPRPDLAPTQRDVLP